MSGRLYVNRQCHVGCKLREECHVCCELTEKCHVACKLTENVTYVVS